MSGALWNGGDDPPSMRDSPDGLLFVFMDLFIRSSA